MKRFISYLSIIFILTSVVLASPQQHVYADFPPFDYLLHILPTILSFFSSYPPKKTVQPQVAGEGGWGFSLNFGSDGHIKQTISGELVGQSNSWQHTLPTLDNIQEGLELRNGCISLLSNTLQQNAVKWPPDNYYHITANHTLNFYDEIGGACHHPDQGRPTNLDDLGWNNVYPASELCWATLSDGTLSTDDLNFPVSLPDEKVTLENGFCNEQDKGQPIKVLKWGDTSDEFYTGIDQTQYSVGHFFTAQEIADARNCVMRIRNHRSTNSCPDLIAHVGASIVLSTNNPGAANVALWTGKGPDGEKEGFTYTLIPSKFDLSNEHGIFEGLLELNSNAPQTFHNNPIDIPKAVYAYEFGRRQHIQAFNCALTDQADIAKSGQTCQFPVSSGGTGSISGDVTSSAGRPATRPANLCADPGASGGLVSNDAIKNAITQATAGKIPSCVLDGVAQNEGAYEGTYLVGGKCAPNECGATGPFQITIGHTFTTDSSACKQDTSCKACGLTSCPNAIKDYGLPANTNPCDPLSAAQAAVSLLQSKSNNQLTDGDPTAQQLAIITAANNYYGSSEPVDRFGGCSYGEQVYKNCDASYVCQSQAQPTPAADQTPTPAPLPIQ